MFVYVIDSALIVSKRLKKLRGETILYSHPSYNKVCQSRAQKILLTVNIIHDSFVQKGTVNW